VLQSVDVGELSLEAYRGTATDELLARVREAAAGLRGLRVLHVNATAYGGGVSELLGSVVPLLRDLGLHADWHTISGDQHFFEATKVMHNALQGAERDLTEEERSLFRANSALNTNGLDGYDVVMVHDPQPAALPQTAGKGSARWIWRCHIDTSRPNPGTWSFLREYLAAYDAAVFTMPAFVPPALPIERLVTIAPAIDPLSPKNLPLPDGLARQVLNWIGVRLDRPLITQVSRFDPWKDPFGVIRAYRLVREEIPDLELALVGSMALDDPEGWRLYREIEAETRHDRHIHVFTNLTGVGNIEVNAFQRLSDVVVQKSIREGFGLVVSEALWKGTPVVAGRTGGIPLQMGDGAGGILVDNVEDCATAVLHLLRDRETARAMAERGRERVRHHFLLPRLLLDELTLFREVLGGVASRQGSGQD
jgi:trehalose synthase